MFSDVLNPVVRRLPRMPARARGVAGALLAGGALLAAASPAGAAPQWLSPQPISPTGFDGAEQQVAMDPGGDAVVVWRESGPIHTAIFASERPAGGSFDSPQTLSEAGQSARAPQVAGDARGDAVAVWLRSDGTDERVQAAYRPAGGSFGTPQTLSEAGVNAQAPQVAMNGAGEAVVVWDVTVAGKSQVQAAGVAPGGAFAASTDLTGLTTEALEPQVALDARGEAIAVWDSYDGANIRIAASVRPPGGGFGAPQYISSTGANSDTPQVAFDAAGDALAVWRYDQPPASTIQAAYRPAGGAFGSPQAVSVPGSTPAQAPQVAFDGHGEGVVAWQQSDATDVRVYASVRAAGATGTFSTPTTLDPGGQEAYAPRVAGDGLSGTIVSWETFNGITNYTQAVARSAGGSFSAAGDVSPASPELTPPAVGIDAQGNGIAVFSPAGGGGEYRVEAAGYDGAGPLQHGLTIPTQGTVGQPLQFFQAPLDVWSGVLSEGFSFGDGSSASGVSATHTYSAPGAYQVSATATDTLGNVTTVTHTVTIAPQPTAATATASKPKPKHKRRRKHHHKRRHHPGRRRRGRR